MTIFDKANKRWKENRVLYQMTDDEKKSMEQTLLIKEEMKLYKEELNNLDYWSKYQKQKHSINIEDRLTMTNTGLEFIYGVIRKYKPQQLIETGVHHGSISFIILLALNQNKEGNLTSIEKNVDKKTGQYVPNELRDRWNMIKGESQNILSKVEKDIDFFIHDSLHTYNNMYWEYEWAFKNMKPNAILISHDIGANNSFFDFVENYKSKWYLAKDNNKNSNYGIGIAIRPTKIGKVGTLKRDKKIKPKGNPKFKRNHFDYALAFIKRCEDNIKGFSTSMDKVKSKTIPYEPLLIINDKVIGRLAPRARFWYGGTINGKQFRVNSKEGEDELFELIKDCK